MRVYVAPRGLWLTLDAGAFEEVAVNTRTPRRAHWVIQRYANTPQARLRVEQPAQVPGIGTYGPREQLTKEREAYSIPLRSGTTWVELSDGR